MRWKRNTVVRVAPKLGTHYLLWQPRLPPWQATFVRGAFGAGTCKSITSRAVASSVVIYRLSFVCNFPASLRLQFSACGKSRVIGGAPESFIHFRRIREELGYCGGRRIYVPRSVRRAPSTWKAGGSRYTKSSRSAAPTPREKG